MSTVSKGASRVGSTMTRLFALGYRCGRISASGQAKGSRIDEQTLRGDIIAIAPLDSLLPHLLVEVGGVKKSVKQALLELTKHGLPAGFVPLVARCIGRRWRYHGANAKGHDSLGAALEPHP